jgi:nuclear transport factor 2 (NTF2) superfamily protein
MTSDYPRENSHDGPRPLRHDPENVSPAYTEDTVWRDRAEFIHSRQQVIELLSRKWALEFDYRLIKELWAFHENRVAVRYAYRWHDDSSHWCRSYGNENWNSTSTASCASASPPSMTYRSRKSTANSTGLSVANPMTTLG